MSKRKRRDDETAPGPESAPGSPVDGGGPVPASVGPPVTGGSDRREVRAALLAFAIPFLSQCLQRGDVWMRMVDALILLPSFAILYGIHRLLYPGRLHYFLLVFLLSLASAGADAFAYIGLFAGAVGLLFLALPALAAGPLYLRRRFDRLAVARDYFLAGLRILGVAGALFGAAILPHLFITSALPLPEGARFAAFEPPSAPGVPVVVRRYELPAGATLLDVARHVDTCFTRPLVARSGEGFAFSLRTVFPFFRRGYTLVAAPEGGKLTLRVAEGPGEPGGHLLPLAPPPAASLARYRAPRGGLEGTYDPAALTLLSKEMAEDAGLSGDLVFVANGLEGCMIQVVCADPGPDVKMDHLVALFEEAVIRKEYPSFKVRTNERRTVADRTALVVAGDSELKGERRRLGFVVLEGDGAIVTLVGISTLECADAFDDLFRGFVEGVSFPGPPAR